MTQEDKEKVTLQHKLTMIQIVIAIAALFVPTVLVVFLPKIISGSAPDAKRQTPPIESLPENKSIKPSADSKKTQIKKPIIPSPDSLKSIGWIRIGAIRSNDGKISVGERLVSIPFQPGKISQPVTISPLKVPSIGNIVKIINGVNVRVDPPKEPNYNLSNKQQNLVLMKEQKIIIVKTYSFVDPTSPPNFTSVWAEVKTLE
jgi:hypothetical protein